MHINKSNLHLYNSCINVPFRWYGQELKHEVFTHRLEAVVVEHFVGQSGILRVVVVRKNVCALGLRLAACFYLIYCQFSWFVMPNVIFEIMMMLSIYLNKLEEKNLEFTVIAVSYF